MFVYPWEKPSVHHCNCIHNCVCTCNLICVLQCDRFCLLSVDRLTWADKFSACLCLSVCICECAYSCVYVCARVISSHIHYSDSLSHVIETERARDRKSQGLILPPPCPGPRQTGGHVYVGRGWEPTLCCTPLNPFSANRKACKVAQAALSQTGVKVLIIKLSSAHSMMHRVKPGSLPLPLAPCPLFLSPKTLSPYSVTPPSFILFTPPLLHSTKTLSFP